MGSAATLTKLLEAVLEVEAFLEVEAVLPAFLQVNTFLRLEDLDSGEC